jgi:hypothetical protein
MWFSFRAKLSSALNQIAAQLRMKIAAQLWVKMQFSFKVKLSLALD